jgi:hypothetical protein
MFRIFPINVIFALTPGDKLTRLQWPRGSRTAEFGWADQLSWGYVLYASPTYHQVVKNVDLIPRVAFSHNVEGTSPSPVSQFVAGRMSATLSATALYVDRWSLELSYTNFWGASPRNSLVDRDFVSATVKHWF